MSPPVLKPPYWDREFVVKVDASGYGLGAILSQLDDQGEEHPVVFASRKLQPRELKLATTEKGCLAIVWAVEMFRYYFLGRSLQNDGYNIDIISLVKPSKR